MFSSGAGANGNSSLGTGVVGGMLIGTLALLFVVPVFYIIFEYLQHCLIRGLQYELGVSCPDTNTAFYQCSLKLLCT